MTEPAPRPAAPEVGAEFFGTAFLLAAIVGSGAMAQSLTDDVGLQLLQNALAVGAALFALIVTIGPISGAHFNPAVTTANLLLGRIDERRAAWFVAAQVAGAAVGTIAANTMFGRAPLEISATDRGEPRLIAAEAIATFGLLAVVFVTDRFHDLPVVAATVAGYVTAAFAFTSSTCFANPAVTIGRTLTDSFAGVAPSAVPGFVAAQFLMIPVAVFVVRPVIRPQRPAAPAPSR